MNLRHLLILLLTPFIWACDTDKSSDTYSYFVTTLGTDTLAIERFQKLPTRVVAHVVLRSPETKLMGYQMKLNEQGEMAKLTRFDPPDTYFETIGSVLGQTITSKGDSLIHELMGGNGEPRRYAMLNQSGSLPFIDMVHWPFELAFNQAMESDSDSIDQKLVTGRRLSNFIIHKVSSDSLTLRHPSRGVMGVTVDRQGNLIKLDAGLTTRKLVVRRTDELDFEKIANSFLERDTNGSPFGSLSGAVKEGFSFKGANFELSYGSPAKRGRTIFGGIVSWNERWRTGANRATHFKTSKDLKIGQLEVPAGEYTLFTIPAPDGGTLIINTQTGQNGRSYKPELDLGRVPMNLSTEKAVVENFTIVAEESPNGGVLKLKWDQAVFSIPFIIKE